MIVMVAMLLGLTVFQYYRAKHNPQTASPNAVTQSQGAEPDAASRSATVAA